MEHQRISPDLREQDGALDGIEALPKRVDRYGKAKTRALNIANHINAIDGLQTEYKRLSRCADYLLFRHYFTVDKVRLHAAQFCKIHLLCPMCAIRRGAKALAAYLQRFEAIKLQRPQLRAWMVTLTVKDGDNLEERFKHLHKSQRELWKRKQRGRGSVLDGVAGAVWSYEVKRGNGSGLWHPHLHMVALAEHEPDKFALSAEWESITGDSKIVDVRPISQEDPATGFSEVFKYAVKFSDQSEADTVHAYQTLKRRRLLDCSGCFRGVEIPESLLDEPLDGLPYVELLYRFMGKGYNLSKHAEGACREGAACSRKV